MPRCGSFVYEVIHKNVKSVCIRVTTDKRVTVTAPKRVSLKQIEDFVTRKQEWIENKLAHMDTKVILHVDEQEWNQKKEEYLTGVMAEIYPRFVQYHISYPVVRYRKMVSRYGTCQPGTGKITLNKILADMPKECAEYVVAHELAHLVEANHSKAFYNVLSEVMPDYKKREGRLAEYALHH